jgi:hypothetical protein
LHGMVSIVCPLQERVGKLVGEGILQVGGFDYNNYDSVN